MVHSYLAGPSFLFCDPWESWILQQSQYVCEHKSVAQTAVLTLLCLTTTGHLGRIFLLSSYGCQLVHLGELLASGSKVVGTAS